MSPDTNEGPRCISHRGPWASGLHTVGRQGRPRTAGTDERLLRESGEKSITEDHHPFRRAGGPAAGRRSDGVPTSLRALIRTTAGTAPRAGTRSPVPLRSSLRCDDGGRYTLCAAECLASRREIFWRGSVCAGEPLRRAAERRGRVVGRGRRGPPGPRSRPARPAHSSRGQGRGEPGVRVAQGVRRQGVAAGVQGVALRRGDREGLVDDRRRRAPARPGWRRPRRPTPPARTVSTVDAAMNAHFAHIARRTSSTRVTVTPSTDELVADRAERLVVGPARRAGRARARRRATISSTVPSGSSVAPSRTVAPSTASEPKAVDQGVEVGHSVEQRHHPGSGAHRRAQVGQCRDEGGAAHRHDDEVVDRRAARRR